MVLQDDKGNKVELPVDKVEDIVALQEQAKGAETLKSELAKANEALELAKKGGGNERGIPAMREHIKNLEKMLKDKGGEVKPFEETPAVTPEMMQETARKTYEEGEANKVESRRQTYLNDLSGGDENKKKVIEEKFKLLSGGRKISNQDEMIVLMGDAAHLANRTATGGSRSPAQQASSGDPSGMPRRSVGTADRERGAQLASAFGYKFKGDPSKLTK